MYCRRFKIYGIYCGRNIIYNIERKREVIKEEWKNMLSKNEVQCNVGQTIFI